MPKQIIIAEQYRIAAVFSEDQIEEIVVAAGTHQVGDVYLGVVENVLTSIDAAFVNIGDGDRNGFIHITDLGPLKMRRSSGSISDLVVPQQRVLVQVMKEPTGNKGPRLTGNISLPGRYVVLLPFGRGVNLSRRIRSESERNRLRALAILIKPAGMGILVRTEADGMPEEQIIEDLDNLQRQWEGIQQDVATTRQPTLLDRERDFVQRVLRDLYSTDVNRIVTDSSDGLRRIKQHLLNWGDGKIPSGLLLDHHRERTPILEYFRVNAGIREALKPRVDLPSGGYVIIEPTEALTVIDVNSGSFTKSQTSRETVLWTNCEAAVEIARQIRLRNIAGVIVVDFIDMDTRRDQLQLLEYFNKALRADKSRPQIAQLTELGLVELTRKRQGQSIYELFGRPCSTCGGLGHLMHLPGEVAGQPVDSTSRTWESKQSNQLDFTSEYEDGDSELGGGLEPNLVNHPSYQERGNLRRRSKRTLLNKDSRDLRELEKVAPVDVRSRVESRFEPRFEPRVDREIVERAIPSKIALPSISPTKHIAEPVEELVEIVEPAPIIAAPEVSIPERPNKRELRTKVVEPPEVIVVEMTEEEQDVYSLIGVSPLVLVDREVKDPRNVIVTVALPGQAPKNAIKSSPAILNASIAEDVVEPETPEEIDSEAVVNELPIVTTNNGITNPNGVILKVNRAQPSEPIDDEANNSKNDFLDSSKEFVPIQSPEASRRKRSSASQ
ncbi:MAG: Rne/Rng family ribonuclease [Pseudanabaena sp.]|jgi:ribonuclease E|uniref:Rne/Rng family ribonuclease n=1 Tax=Pseudanabaena mucicola TaxID=71190 RepID=UPI002575D02F|nr:Rne/Rng family ribonuclease [Pseudanabaena mucicola]MCA6586728.1 Rne/Rng family ribonuclease [Pseudanabaena sp. M051S1SP1A06QC]MCA6590176.1 Rne/Rng family ribonuclease [Pseudanabaena sp. M109S1SP1A06QC]MCA6603423.1 Rne/Rng family ribonuclease [Pseudanabaena sp. M007S1SP1A06QC]MCA6613152.1 Rne/Rng family ribonuclease [Pseudanabaena sp. M090S1SP1A06QC]MCA6624577.1 Rne/Rng family ribonuclease [Pseudanabaena sp. M165S2SP1A06QC]MCE2975238.1 Rne/Rng family ribonuclease [Pseudanabaena sp. CoA8_M7